LCEVNLKAELGLAAKTRKKLKKETPVLRLFAAVFFAVLAPGLEHDGAG
jgi:hypothetical protein